MTEHFDAMSAKSRLKARIRQTATLRRSGQLSEVRQILDAIATDPDIEALGQPTALGLPRQLHSAYMKLAKAEKDAVSTIGYQFQLVPPPEILHAHSQFSSAERRAIAEINRTAIPRKIHQIWIGSMPPPASTRAWESHAQTHDYSYKLWLEKDLQQLKIDEHPVYQQMLASGDYPGAVDVARYIILDKLGGIYLDCDWYPARQDISFNDLLPMLGLTVMAEDTPRWTSTGPLLLANSMIATPAEHPVMQRLISVLDDVNSALPDAPAWWTTGPLIFTVVCRGGSATLADARLVAGSLPQETALHDVQSWCRQAQADDGGLLLLWKSWVWPLQ